MTSQHSRHCTVELHALPSRIGQVRRIISAQLRYWRLDPLIDHAALGVTELLTNVLRHAQPDKRCTVDVELLLDRLTVSVSDHDPRLPNLTAAATYDTGGRGLALIAAVCQSWGVSQSVGGKSVWFTLPAPAGTIASLSSHCPVYGAATDGPFDTADLAAVVLEYGHATARSAVMG
ncbi:ATP-binding protein [Streptomyces sp. NBC_01497]|uniref:ATP-binding protein n=1 Tax=Streptomyces sp. NBC_01497 TaxID=2903885 RepID=UPI002E308CF1|nr:ATP-binding protein [Streptomyces sp. NBC_01497]